MVVWHCSSVSLSTALSLDGAYPGRPAMGVPWGPVVVPTGRVVEVYRESGVEASLGAPPAL